MHTVVERVGVAREHLIRPFIAALFVVPEYEDEFPRDDLLSETGSRSNF